MKIGIMIQTFNESREISRLAKEIKEQKLFILVVDDGSCDNTPQIAACAGAVVLKNEVNQGKGACLVRGFNYALENNFDAVVTMDGDGQHLPEDLFNLIHAAECSKSDMFIGNRMLKTKNMPALRIATNKFMSWIISRIAGQDIPDTQCGFRLIRKDLIGKLATESSRFEVESEILIKASAAGVKILSVPIETLYGNEASQINPFWDTCRFICFLFKITFVEHR